MANYQWRASTTYNSNTDLSYGVTPSDFNTWQTDTIGNAKSDTWLYWYRDSNTPHYDQWGNMYFTDDDSSRVALSITDSWTTSVDSMNNLTVTVTTKVNSVVRDDLRGSNNDNYARDITIYTQQGGSAVWNYVDYSLSTAHTLLASPGITIAQRSFTISPGGTGNVAPSLFLHNQVPGGSSYDDIWLGVQFRNPLDPPITFSLVYNANGGTGAPATQTATAVSSATFTVSNGTPTWGFYEFLGWSHIQYTDSRTEADVEYRAGDTITLQRANPSLTLYAVWRMDYRPGKTYNNSNTTWWSHDRDAGAANIRNAANTGWTTMRTIGGDGSRTGNPPYIYGNGAWRNQRRIGSE